MQPVTISLNTEKQSMFFLPGGKLHLTFDNPGPVEVDPEKFDAQEKAWITQAHKGGVLFVDNPNKKDTTPGPAVAQETHDAMTPIEGSEQVFDRRDETLEQAKALLSGKVGAIKKAITATDDILLLRLMKEAEYTGKKRSSITKALDDRLGGLQSKLIHDLGGDQGEIGIHITDPSLRNLPEVEEVAEKTIEIKPLSEDDE
jgi:hypothetical protein